MCCQHTTVDTLPPLPLPGERVARTASPHCVTEPCTIAANVTAGADGAAAAYTITSTPAALSHRGASATRWHDDAFARAKALHCAHRIRTQRLAGTTAATADSGGGRGCDGGACSCCSRGGVASGEGGAWKQRDVDDVQSTFL